MTRGRRETFLSSPLWRGRGSFANARQPAPTPPSPQGPLLAPAHEPRANVHSILAPLPASRLRPSSRLQRPLPCLSSCPSSRGVHSFVVLDHTFIHSHTPVQTPRHSFTANADATPRTPHPLNRLLDTHLSLRTTTDPTLASIIVGSRPRANKTTLDSSRLSTSIVESWSSIISLSHHEARPAVRGRPALETTARARLRERRRRRSDLSSPACHTHNRSESRHNMYWQKRRFCCLPEACCWYQHTNTCHCSRCWVSDFWIYPCIYFND